MASVRSLEQLVVIWARRVDASSCTSMDISNNTIGSKGETGYNI